eukprot:scaffold11463_cov124-Isochrysis_galbana.AAC.2
MAYGFSRWRALPRTTSRRPIGPAHLTFDETINYHYHLNILIASGALTLQPRRASARSPAALHLPAQCAAVACCSLHASLHTATVLWLHRFTGCH